MSRQSHPYNPFLPVWEVIQIGAVPVAPAAAVQWVHTVTREMIGLQMYPQVRDNTGGNTFRVSPRWPDGSGPAEASDIPVEIRALSLPGHSRRRLPWPLFVDEGDTITGSAIVTAGLLGVVGDLVIAGMSVDVREHYLRALHGWRAWRALLNGIARVPIFDSATGQAIGSVSTVDTLVELFTRPNSRRKLTPTRSGKARLPRWHIWRPTNVPFVDGVTSTPAPYVFNEWGLVIAMFFAWELGVPQRSLISLSLDEVPLMNRQAVPTPRVDPVLAFATEFSEQEMDLPFPFMVSEVSRMGMVYEIPAGGAGTEGVIELVTPYIEGPPEQAIPDLADYLQGYAGFADPETVENLARLTTLPWQRDDQIGLESIPVPETSLT